MLEIDLVVDSIYTIYIKVRYHKDQYFMLGNQFGFKYSSDESFVDMFMVIKDRLKYFYERYNLIDEDIVYLQVVFRLLNKNIYSDLVIDKNKFKHVTKTERKDTLDLVVIPTATTEDGLGKCLPVVLDSNNNIKEVNIVIKDTKSNFLDIIIEKTKYIKKNHRDAITSFD